jgi:carbamate kinase
MRVVVALGGNAIQPRGERGTIPEQRAAIREACDGLAAIAWAGHELVVTHGNGPQVGRMMWLDETAPSVFPRYPLDVHVAETQGQLGYLLQQELAGALRRARVERPVAALVTQVVVDPADPAFLRATKPVGPVLDEAGAAELRARGEPVGRAGDGWRRLVPSPEPREIVEKDAIGSLVSSGAVVIAAGGGGIPVVREGNAYRGVPAVVDKDLAAALLLVHVRGDLLLILTDVDRVERGYGTDRAEPIDRISVAAARAAIETGEFPPGSMGPKVLAAVRAVEAGARARIASLADAADAVKGKAGTEIVP